jgi:hypothetical protein
VLGTTTTAAPAVVADTQVDKVVMVERVQDLTLEADTKDVAVTVLTAGQIKLHNLVLVLVTVK